MEEEYIRVCKECDEEVGEHTWTTQNDGIDGVSICSGCGTIEPNTEEITQEEYERRVAFYYFKP